MLTEVLITGGTGFIGRELIQEISLDSNFSKIYCVTRNPNQINNNHPDTLKYINHRDSLSLLRSEPIGAIIHLATMYKRPGEIFSEREMWQSNVEIPIELLHTASERDLYFLNTNSYLQYDPTISSSDHYYLKTKRYFQKYLESYKDGFQFKHGSIVVGDTYGVGDKRDKVLNHMIHQALEGKMFKVNNPKATMRLTHVGNIAKGIREIANLQIQETISTVSNFEINIDSLAQFVFNVISRKSLELDDYHLELSKSNWTAHFRNFSANENPKSGLHKFLLLTAHS